MKLTRKSKDTQVAIRKALVSGAALGSLLAGLAAQSKAAQGTDCLSLGRDMPVTTNAVSEVEAKQPVVVGKRPIVKGMIKITPRRLAGVPMQLPRDPPVHAGMYRVRAGDTLTKIARENKTTVSELKRLNGFDDERANHIKAGEVIKVAETTR